MDQQRVTDILTRARAAVDAAGLPDDLRPAAYTAAVGLLLGTQPSAEAAVSSATQRSQPGDGDSSGRERMLDRVAAGLGIDPSRIRDLFEEDDGMPVLIVKSSALPRSRAGGAYDIALLVMAARQLGGIDDYTDAGVLRDAAKRYGKFDQGNFGKHMGALDNLVLTSGKRSTTKRKLTKPGVEAAAETAKKYLGVQEG